MGLDRYMARIYIDAIYLAPRRARRPMAESLSEFFALIARLILGFTFLRAGVLKFGNRDHFESAVQKYDLAGPAVSHQIALLLPPMELVLGSFLLVGLAQSPVSLLLAGLLLMFETAVIVNLLRGRVIDCGCFGAGSEREITWWTVLRNGGLVVAALFVAANPAASLALDGGDKPLRADEAVAAAAVAVCGITLFRVGTEAIAARRAADGIQTLRQTWTSVA